MSTSDASSPVAKPTRPRIDCHTHILPRNLPKGYFKDFAPTEKYVHFEPCCGSDYIDMYEGGKFFRRVEPNCFHPEHRLKDMEETGVTVQVLSTVPVMFSYWDNAEDALDLSRRINDEILEVVKEHPTRFIGLGTLPMSHPEIAIEELRRIMAAGLVGVEIGSNVQDLPLSDPKFYPIFEACAELGASVFIHPWNMPRPETNSKYWLPWLVGMPAETAGAICSFIFSGIFQKLPKLRVMFAHGGGSFPGTIGRIEHGYKVRPDLVACDNDVNPRDCIPLFWIDSLVHDHDAMQLCLKLWGTQKIAMGSDYPFPLGEHKPGQLIESAEYLSEEQKNQLLWKTAFDWLGISDNQFKKPE